MSSGDEFGAVGYLAPQSLEAHRALARQFSVNDSGIVELHGSRNSSRIGLAIPNNCYGDWDQESDPRTPTSPHPFIQRTNSHPPLASSWANHPPMFVQAPDKYIKVPDYEELPNSNRNPDDLGVYTPIDEGSVIVATLKRPQYATNPTGKQPQSSITNIKENSRLRTNPLYDQSGGSFTLPPYPPPRKILCSGRSCCLQTFGFLFALTALAVVLMSFLAGRSDEPKYAELVKDLEDLRSNFSNLHQMVQNSRNDASFLSGISDFNPIVQLLHNNSEMLQTLNDLETKVKSLRMQVSLQEASNQNLTNQIATLTDQITFVKSQENHANETFENLKQSLGEMKQLKVRGYNMSACSHDRKSNGRSSAFEDTLTDSLDLSNVLVLGVLCTTSGGTEALLEDKAGNTYRCICRGRRDGEDSRFCILHYWTCPPLP